MNDANEGSLETLLIGIDGACLPVLEPLIEAGELPTLERVFDRGVVGTLESQIPPWTPSAWPSLYTGMNPGKHGVFDFLRFDGYDWDLVDHRDVNAWALWELLDHHGRSSVVVNVPITHPPRPFDGALVPGYVGGDPPDCHPPGLLDEIRDELGEYRLYAPREASLDERAEWYRELTRMRGRAFRYLVDRFDPDFGFLQFQQTDTLFHEQPENDGVVRDVYAAVDAEIDAVLTECDPTHVVVASDHGIGPYDGWEFRVNTYLRECGYVETKRGGEGMPSWTALARRQFGREDPQASRKQRRLERLFATAAGVGVTSQRAKLVLDRLGLTDLVLDVLPRDTVRAATEQVDFARSVAYMRSRTELGVRLNVAGRDPDGIVPPSQYEAVREAVVRDLRSVRTPDGDPVFERVAPSEEWFDGPHTHQAVDIVTVPTEFEHYLSASLRREQFSKPSGLWNHKMEGVVALMGPEVDVSASIDDAHLFDVAPTVLSTLGVPPSERMDGSALACVERLPVASYPPFVDRGEPASGDDEGVERLLADLGYLELDGDS